MKLKICGLMSLHDVSCVNAAGVDYGGFVFTPHRQQISTTIARELKSALNPAIKAVGVFINEPFDFVRSIVSAGLVDLVQFHGDTEYPLPCPTIKAFRMKSAADIRPTNCDYVLFDAFSSSGGSMGKTFDWGLIEKYRENPTKPFFLAGGINASNIKAAVALNPYCIDISSGAEENGRKSLEKIKEIYDYVQGRII